MEPRKRRIRRQERRPRRRERATSPLPTDHQNLLGCPQAPVEDHTCCSVLDFAIALGRVVGAPLLDPGAPFITLARTRPLDGTRAVFGELLDGLAAIGAVRTDAGERPREPVTLESLRIERGAQRSY